MKAQAHLDVNEALAWFLTALLWVGLTGADPGSSLTEESPAEDSGRADWDRNKRPSPENRLSLMPRSRWDEDFILVLFISASAFTGYVMVSRPVNRRNCCHSPYWPGLPSLLWGLPSLLWVSAHGHLSAHFSLHTFILVGSPASSLPLFCLAQCSNLSTVSGSVNADWR